MKPIFIVKGRGGIELHFIIQFHREFIRTRKRRRKNRRRVSTVFSRESISNSSSRTNLNLQRNARNKTSRPRERYKLKRTRADRIHVPLIQASINRKRTRFELNAELSKPRNVRGLQCRRPRRKLQKIPSPSTPWKAADGFDRQSFNGPRKSHQATTSISRTKLDGTAISNVYFRNNACYAKENNTHAKDTRV